MRRCDGGSWRCGWCEAKIGETSGKGPGPDGPGSLCSTCSSRFRAGHTGPPQQDEEGRCAPSLLCPAAVFSPTDIASVRRVNPPLPPWATMHTPATHLRTVSVHPQAFPPSRSSSIPPRRIAPERPSHLAPIALLSSVSPPAAPRYVCECLRTFETIAAMGVHRRHCDGGKWLCSWCGCSHSETSGKGAGPDGPRTLCAACASRYRAGHREPPQRDSSGKFLCGCGRAFESMSGLGSHRRHCSQAPTKAPAAAATEPNAEATGGGDAAEAREAATEPAVHAAGAGDGTEI